MLDQRTLLQKLNGTGVEFIPVPDAELERLLGSIERVSGSALCPVCGHEVRKHVRDGRIRDYDGRFSTIRTCDGRLVHT